MTLQQIISDKTLTATGIAATASPWWLPVLKQTSEVAGLLLPIFGVALLLVQIILKIKNSGK